MYTDAVRGKMGQNPKHKEKLRWEVCENREAELDGRGLTIVCGWEVLQLFVFHMLHGNSLRTLVYKGLPLLAPKTIAVLNALTNDPKIMT